MKISLVQIGGTVDNYLKLGVAEYLKRLLHYVKFTVVEIPDIKNSAKLSHEELKKREGEEILKKITSEDVVILLDNRGKMYTSEELAEFLQTQMNRSIKHLVFIIGGAFGFSDEVYQRANGQLSLSKMTFSHRMIRLLFTEQLYRAFTILNNEPYHH